MRPVVIVNDLLGGWMGERTFWNYMLEGIPGIQGFDHVTMNCPISDVHVEAQKCVRDMPPETIIIQNATFLRKISDDNFTIAFLQDNMRATGYPVGVQEHVLKTSQMVVANSQETAKAYPEFNPRVIPIGIDTSIFHPAYASRSYRTKRSLREEYDVPSNKLVGIFIGEFSEVKGWPEVKALIDSHPEIFFILVSKREEKYEAVNTKCFYKLDQSTLAKLHNCADFFLLGSPIETQCLAALEAASCGLPIVMKRTGIFMDLNDGYKNAIGVFNDNLSTAFQEFLSDPNRFYPRGAMLSLDFGIDSMIYKWRALLESI